MWAHGLVEMAVLGVKTVDWFKTDDFCRIRCQVCCALLHAPGRVMAMFDFVGSPVCRGNNLPRIIEGKFELANAAFGCSRPNGATSKDNVSGIVYSGIATA